ncbi:MAG: M48 family metalloprotease [Janthinobacterium lividum]
MRAFRHLAVPVLAVSVLASCASQQQPGGSAPASAVAAAPGSSAALRTTTILPEPIPATLVAQSPEEVTLREMVMLQDRLYRVSAPLLVKNTDLCTGNARSLLGFIAKNKYSYSDELSQAAQALYGLDDRLRVTGVLAGSGAARAGMRAGDIIDAVDATPMPQGPNAERQAATLLAPLVAGAGARNGIRLTVLRNGARLPITVTLTRACAYSVELGNADHVNAYHDGRRVLLTRGMLNATRTDDELAYVLAREMAHNALQHASKQAMTGTMGDIIDNLMRVKPDLSGMAGSAGVKASTREFDAAADTMALYMLARAGYDYNAAPQFWERLASQVPASVLNGYTAIHPATAYRLEVMARVLPEVRNKQAHKMPLLP